MFSLHSNKIMEKLVENVLQKVIDDKVLMFHGRYIGDSLVVVKPEHLDLLYDPPNGF